MPSSIGAISGNNKDAVLNAWVSHCIGNNILIIKKRKCRTKKMEIKYSD